MSQRDVIDQGRDPTSEHEQREDHAVPPEL
jgi:hypothetical protein